jgi:hypothetical protein
MPTSPAQRAPVPNTQATNVANGWVLDTYSVANTNKQQEKVKRWFHQKGIYSGMNRNAGSKQR